MLVGSLWLWFTSGWAGVVVWRRRVEVVVRMWREEVVVGRGSWSSRGKSVGLGWRGNCAKREGRNGGAKWEGRSGCVKGKMVKSWRDGLVFCRKGRGRFALQREVVVGEEKWEEENRLLRRGSVRRISECARGE